MSSSISNEPPRAESPTSSSTNPTLPRGGACLPCRKRKMRCDGAKPACGQCVSKRRAEDCEYTNVQGLTRSQILEENIAILESRIRELEKPGESAPSVRLYDPHFSTSTVGENTEGDQTPVIPPLRFGGSIGAMDIRPDVSSSSSASTTTASQDPKLQELTAMIYAFLPYASQFGFFLHIPRFLQLSLTAPSGDVRHIDGLLSAVCLWGSRLSRNTALHAREPELLSQTMQQVASSLFITGQGTRGHDVLYVIQAEVLLANYFFFSGRFLEGRYHCGAAVSLALSCRLNLIGSNTDSGTGLEIGGPVEFPAYGLPPPEDAIQEGERINAFWSVYMLDKAWAVALNSNSSISEEGPGRTEIHTPWPAPMEAYEAGFLRDTVPTRNTVQSFIAGVDVGDGQSSSPLALHAKATALYAHAFGLASKYKDDQVTYGADLFTLDNYITVFTAQLAFGDDARSEANQHSLVARTLARVALIQLHNDELSGDSRRHDACMAAANSALAVVENLKIDDIKYLDPIMAILLVSIGQVFITEISRVKTALQHSGSSTHNDVYLTGLMSSVNRILAILTDFGTTGPLMAMQAAILEQARVTAV